MWYDAPGKNTDVVVGTKVVITRNIKGFPFVSKMSDSDKENVLGMVRQAGSQIGLDFVRTDELDDVARSDIFNKGLVATSVVNGDDKYGILISKKEGVGVIINSIDHISIVSLVPGDDVYLAYKRAEELAVHFEKSMDIAFSDKYGFLSPRLSTVGTGVRVSVCVALPGIEKTSGALPILTKRIEKYDWSLNAVANVDGSMRETSLYTINSLTTLGITEQELIDGANRLIADTIKLERSCRKNICTKKKAIVEDQFYRAYATLKYLRRVEFSEAMTMIAWLRLGQDYIKHEDIDITWEKINRLTNMVRKNYDDYSRDRKVINSRPSQRAELIRSIMKGDIA